MSHSICDFCSASPVAWRYPARSFVAYAVAGVVGESVGDWTACGVCHGLIEAGDRRGLLERSIQTFLAQNPEADDVEPVVRAQIAAFHRMFFAHRSGEPVPVLREEAPRCEAKPD